jgi:hypothetical protein
LKIIKHPSYFAALGVSPIGVNLTISGGVPRGNSPLAGFGVSPKNLFFSFCSPPQAASEEKKNLGTPQNPGREDPAPLKLTPMGVSPLFLFLPKGRVMMH